MIKFKTNSIDKDNKKKAIEVSAKLTDIIATTLEDKEGTLVLSSGTRVIIDDLKTFNAIYKEWTKPFKDIVSV